MSEIISSDFYFGVVRVTQVDGMGNLVVPEGELHPQRPQMLLGLLKVGSVYFEREVVSRSGGCWLSTSSWTEERDTNRARTPWNAESNRVALAGPCVRINSLHAQNTLIPGRS